MSGKTPKNTSNPKSGKELKEKRPKTPLFGFLNKDPKLSKPKAGNDRKSVKGKEAKKEKKTKELHLGRVIARVSMIVVLAGMLIIVSFAGAVYAYQEQFEGKALYGTKIFGQDLGGLTKAEILKEVSQNLGKIVFQFSVDGVEITATPEEMGISYQADITADSAYGWGRSDNYFLNLGYSAISLAYKINQDAGSFLAANTNYQIYQNIDIKYSVDDAKLDAFAMDTAKKFESKSKDAGLVIRGEEVQVIPAIYGRAVDAESIKKQIKTALDTEKSSVININVAEVRPDITEEEVQSTVAAAKRILKLPVSYSYDGKTYTPTEEVIGSWLVFNKSEKVLVPTADPSKVSAYLDGIAKGINIQAVNQKVKVVNQGAREITQTGKDGLAVDVKTAATKTTSALNSGQGISFPLTTYVVKYKTEVNNVIVANWEKYIEIDISSQTMCAYLAGGEKVNCWAITTGRSGWATPIGTFVIRRKAGPGGVDGGPGGGGVCMPNPPDTTPLCGINYVSTFTVQGHAIHEAWWRRRPGDANYFGNPNYRWNGSHGCINSPYDVAKFIYYWAPLGTPVVIHY